MRCRSECLFVSYLSKVLYVGWQFDFYSFHLGVFVCFEFAWEDRTCTVVHIYVLILWMDRKSAIAAVAGNDFLK